MDALFDGVRILDLTRLLPGPFATVLFADSGADVIKIEDRKGGDYARYYPPLVGDVGAFFASINRNKRSIALDLKADEDRDTFEKLVATADVVIESFRPGVMAKLGYDFESLKTFKPDIILCSISGYGQDGPFRDRAGHDLNYLARTGLLSLNGRPETTPAPPPFQLADLAGGALYAALGVSGALFRRERSGEGSFLDISMTEGAMSFAIPAIAQHALDPVERGEGMLTGGVPCYDVYETKDGRYLSVAPLEPKFWSAFLAVIDRLDLLNEGYDGTGKVHAELTEIIASETLETWVTRFEEVDACVEPVLSFDEIATDAVHTARKTFFQLAGVTHMRTPLTPFEMTHQPPPQRDQHGDEIREELSRF